MFMGSGFVISEFCQSKCTFFMYAKLNIPCTVCVPVRNCNYILCKKHKMRNTKTVKQTTTNKCREETTMKGFKCTGVNRYRMVNK